MKIVIFGSTGGTELELIKQAIKRDHEVIANESNPALACQPAVPEEK
ncbi:MAG: hypothetical protein M3A44_10440 [Gammaproteobacteria bacterium]